MSDVFTTMTTAAAVHRAQTRAKPMKPAAILKRANSFSGGAPGPHLAPREAAWQLYAAAAVGGEGN
jgi:hypothetical protein